ncbi:MAG: amidohydrolase family protein [Proteobacteria bacterium]|nr:amidohydrolase family protein [Pseudomonadota bacterium]
MSKAPAQSHHYIANRLDWLARITEPALEPNLPIVDPHHHLWDRPGWPYMMPDLLADTSSGHNIVATVFVQCRAFHRAAGPEELRPVGETQFVAGVAAMAESGQYGKTRVCEGIVGHADMTLGARVEPVLEAHVAAGNGRFRGIRHITAWDPDPVIMNPAYQPPQHVLKSPTFVEGLKALGNMGLTFDAWLYHPQIPDLTAAARAVPATRMVLDHVGGPLAIQGYAGKRDDVFKAWSASMRELAICPNVFVKLGGLGMRINGFGFEDQVDPPTSATLAKAWKPYIETCIEAFGASRCMFESNFPVDKGSYSYGVFWNACKLLVKGASAAEKADLFAGTAQRFYRLKTEA